MPFRNSQELPLMPEAGTALLTFDELAPQPEPDQASGGADFTRPLKPRLGILSYIEDSTFDPTAERVKASERDKEKSLAIDEVDQVRQLNEHHRVRRREPATFAYQKRRSRGAANQSEELALGPLKYEMGDPLSNIVLATHDELDSEDRDNSLGRLAALLADYSDVYNEQLPTDVFHPDRIDEEALAASSEIYFAARGYAIKTLLLAVLRERKERTEPVTADDPIKLIDIASEFNALTKANVSRVMSGTFAVRILYDPATGRDVLEKRKGIDYTQVELMFVEAYAIVRALVMGRQEPLGIRTPEEGSVHLLYRKLGEAQQRTLASVSGLEQSVDNNEPVTVYRRAA